MYNCKKTRGCRLLLSQRGCESFFSFSQALCFSDSDVSLLKKFLSSTETSAWLKWHQGFCPVQSWFSLWAHTAQYHLSRGSSDKHLTPGNTSPGLFITSHPGAQASFAGGNKAAWIDKEDGWYQNARKEWFHGQNYPSSIRNDSGYLWLIPNGRARKCRAFLHSARIISMQEPEALCLEQLFIIKKIKMMYCILYSISRDHEDHSTWNTALPRPSCQ